MDRGCRPLEILSVDAVKVVGSFFRLRVQLVVDEETGLKFLDAGQLDNERAVILSPCRPAV